MRRWGAAGARRACTRWGRRWTPSPTASSTLTARSSPTNKQNNWTFRIEDFFHLPPVSMTPLVHLEPRISPWIKKKFKRPYWLLRGLGGNWFMKKTLSRKFHGTVTLLYVLQFIYWLINRWAWWRMLREATAWWSLPAVDSMQSGTSSKSVFWKHCCGSGIQSFLDPWIWIRIRFFSGSQIQFIYSESLATTLWVLKFFVNGLKSFSVPVQKQLSQLIYVFLPFLCCCWIRDSRTRIRDSG